MTNTRIYQHKQNTLAYRILSTVLALMLAAGIFANLALAGDSNQAAQLAAQSEQPGEQAQEAPPGERASQEQASQDPATNPPQGDQPAEESASNQTPETTPPPLADPATETENANLAAEQPEQGAPQQARPAEEEITPYATNAELTIKAEATPATGLSGQTLTESFSVLGQNAPGGALVIFPAIDKNDSIEQTSYTTYITRNGYYEYVGTEAEPFTFFYGGQTISLPRALLVWLSPQGGGTTWSYPVINVNYRLFDNGKTPNGKTFTLQPYLMEATGVADIKTPGTSFAGYISGYNGSVSTMVDMSGGGQNTTAPVTLTATASETWQVTQTFNPSASKDVTVPFDSRTERGYAEVITRLPESTTAEEWATTSHESAARIGYNLNVQSEYNQSGYGRIYNDKITITDTIQHPNGKTPKAITVTTNPADGAKVPVSHTISASTSNSTTITFDAPGVTTEAAAEAQNFLVTVTYDKYDYTTLRPVPSPLPLTEEATNNVQVSWQPATAYFGNTGSLSSASESVSNKLGWFQGEPSLPKLTIQAKLKASGIEREYTTKLARSYENNPNLADTNNSALGYTLTPVANATQTTPTGDPISFSLSLGSNQSLATSSALDFGWYRLKQTGISGTVLGDFAPDDADLAGDGDGVLVYVTNPASDRGIAHIVIGGNTAPGGDDEYSNKNYVVVNASWLKGFLRVYPKEQKTGEYPSVYTNSSVQFDLFNINGDTKIAEFADNGSDVGGTYLQFENIQVGALNYTLKGRSLSEDIALAAVNSWTPVAPQGTGTWPVYSQTGTFVEAAGTKVNSYIAYLDSNKGGFKLGKVFRDTANQPVSEPEFIAQFKLFKQNGEPYSDRPSDLTIDHSEPAYAPFALPAGTYVIKEVGLALGNDKSETNGLYTSGLAKYSLVNGDDVTVTIVTASFGAVPTQAGTPAAGQEKVTDAGQFINRSTYGQLAIQNFHGDGAAKLGSQFTITPPSGSAYNGGAAKTISIPAGGAYTEFVPAGDYIITPVLPSDGTEFIKAATSTTAGATTGSATITVAAATPASATYTYTGSAFANTGAAPAQAAAFAWHYPPRVQGFVYRADIPPSGTETPITSTATFEVWKLATAGDQTGKYLPYNATNFPVTLYPGTVPPATTATAVAGAGGFFTTNYVLPDTSSDGSGSSYLLVQSQLLAGFINPAYYSVFKPSGTWANAVDKATAEATSVPQITIKANEHYGQAASTPLNPTLTYDKLTNGKQQNIPKNHIEIIVSDALTHALLANAKFTLYTDDTCSTLAVEGTDLDVPATNVSDGAGRVWFHGLRPGTYYLKQTDPAQNYVLSGAILKIEIDANGNPTFNDNWDKWNPPANSTLTVGISPNHRPDNQVLTSINLTNIKLPTLKLQKLGENATEFDGEGKRTHVPLPGAGFSIQDEATGYYWKVNTEGTAELMNPQPSGSLTNPAERNNFVGVTSGADGRFIINYLPAGTYKLEEIIVPKPATGEDLEYKAIVRHLSVELNEAKTAYQIHVTHSEGGTVSSRPISEGTTYTLLNEINPHHLKIYKVPLKLADTSKGKAGGFFYDLLAGEDSWEKVAAIDAKFFVYKYDESKATEGYRGAHVDTIYVGTDELGVSNSGTSKQLPAGKYVIEEVRAPMFWGPAGQFTSAQTYYGYCKTDGDIIKDFTTEAELKTALETQHNGHEIKVYPYWKADQTTSFYYKEGKPHNDNNANTDWTASPSLTTVIEIKSDDPDYLPLSIGNSNATRGNSGNGAEHRLARIFGEKDGFVLNLATGEYVKDAVLADVPFDAYPAYKDAAGAWHRLPTIDNKPLASFDTNSANSEGLGRGQFITEYFDISQAFYYGGTQETNLNLAWPVLNTTGVTEWAQYAPNTGGAAGTDPKHPANGTGRLDYLIEGEGVIAIDWAAVKDLGGEALVKQLANSYANGWDVILEEKTKTDGAGSPVSPLPEGYEFDTANPPSFGLHIKYTDALLTTYYANGNSTEGTPAITPEPPTGSANASPAPIILPNYKGSGFIQVAKYGSEDAAKATPLNGATFDVYLVAASAMDSNHKYIGQQGATEAQTAEHFIARTGLTKVTTLTSGTAAISQKLTPGWYLLVETGAPYPYNSYGSYTSESLAKDTGGAVNSLPKPSGNFVSQGPIGPLPVAATSKVGATEEATVVNVTDVQYPSVDIINSWGGVEYPTADYAASYEISYAPAGSPDSFAPFSGQTTITSSGDGTGTNPASRLKFLPDGNYRIHLGTTETAQTKGLNPEADKYFIANIAAAEANKYTTFTVANGAITAGSVQYGGIALSASKPADFSTGNGLWYDVNPQTSKVTALHINHAAKGQLVIRKASKDGSGTIDASPNGTFTFELYAYNIDTGQTIGNAATYTWVTGSNQNGGLRIPLKPGGYRIQEKSASPGYAIDSSEIYVQITEAKEVYLVNKAGTSFAISYNITGMRNDYDTYFLHAGHSNGKTESLSDKPANFYNISSEGTLEIKKIGDESDVTKLFKDLVNLNGAEFEIYKNTGTPENPTVGSKQTELVQKTEPAPGGGGIIYGAYTVTLPAGNYLVKETKAPEGYGLRDDYIPVTVSPATSPSQDVAWTGALKNALVVQDPPLFKLDIAKETKYADIKNGNEILVEGYALRVPGVPIVLWQRKAGTSDNTVASFDAVAGDLGWVPTKYSGMTDRPEDVGVVRFEVKVPGEYRITEQLLSEQGYLTTNNDYKVADAGEHVDAATPVIGYQPAWQLGAGKSLFVKYDKDTNRFAIDTSTEKNNPAWRPNESGGSLAVGSPDKNSGLFVVDNPFNGFVLLAEKFDALTGKLVKGSQNAGTVFGLYKTLADAKAGTNSLQTVTDTAGNGYAWFSPGYTSMQDPRLQGGKDHYGENTNDTLVFYLAEETPPGVPIPTYSIDDWVKSKDPTAIFENGRYIKRVEVKVAEATDKQIPVAFYDVPLTSPTLSVSKNVKAGTPQPQLALESLNATYEIAQGSSLNNNLPLYNYVLNDGAAEAGGNPAVPAFTFKGGSGPTVITGSQPGYKFTAVRIWPSSAYANVTDQATDTDPATGDPGAGSENNRAPVYARINGGTWTLLNATGPTAFSTSVGSGNPGYIPAGTDGTIQYLSIEYSSDNPDQRSGTDKRPIVGTRLSLGKIEADVIFDRFVPSNMQPEVSEISNTVLVNAQTKAGVALAQAQATATLGVDVPVRPVGTVEKVTSDWKIQHPLPDPNKNTFLAGETVQYTMEFKNLGDGTGSKDPKIELPMIVDYMTADTLSVARIGELEEGAGNYDYLGLMGTPKAPTNYEATTPAYKAYLVTGSSTTDITDKATFSEPESNVAVWEFPSLKGSDALAEGSSIRIIFNALISQTPSSNRPTNEVYATSAATGSSGTRPLVPSAEVPHGAYFVANQNDANAVYASSTNPTALEYWGKLASITGLNATNHGLFVRDSVDAITVASSGSVHIAKSVAVGNGLPSSSLAPHSVHIGDSVSFRLAINNSMEEAVNPEHNFTNIRIADTLPRISDGRGTLWSDDLLQVWHIDSTSLKVYYSKAGTRTDLTLTNDYLVSSTSDGSTYVSGLTDKARGFVVSFGDVAAEGSAPGSNFKLEPSSTLYVEYKMVWNGGLSAAEKDSLLEANNSKIAVNSFVSAQQLIINNVLRGDLAMESNKTTLTLASEKVSLSGVSFEDKNYSGLQGTSPSPANSAVLPDVPVELWQRTLASTDNGAHWAVAAGGPTRVTEPAGVTFPTKTGSDGTYRFDGLAPSYPVLQADGTTLERLEYQVRFGMPSAPAGSNWVIAAKDQIDAVLNPENDSLIHATPAETKDSDAYESDGTNSLGTFKAGETDWYQVRTARTHVDAGFSQTATISGWVWEDINGDGIQTSGEPGTPNVKITLQRSADGATGWANWPATPLDAHTTLSALVADTVNNHPIGYFSFSGLRIPTGDTAHYRLVYDKSGVTHAAYTYEWTQKDAKPEGESTTNEAIDSDVDPATGTAPGLTDLAPAEDRTLSLAMSTHESIRPEYGAGSPNNAAGLKPLGKFITGIVWEDRNNDGLRNDATFDAVKPGVAVWLYSADDSYAAPIAKTTTNALGRYTFYDASATDANGNPLTPDVSGRPLAIDFSKEYKVEFYLPTTPAAPGSWVFAPANQGNDSTIDSDAITPSPSSGAEVSRQTAVAGGDAALSSVSLDAGILQTSTMSGLFWRDANGDGIQNDSPLTPDPSTDTLLDVKLQRLTSDGSGGTTWSDLPGQTAQISFLPNSGSVLNTYSFAGLVPGEYRVYFDRTNVLSASETYCWTQPGQGSDYKLDSDAHWTNVAAANNTTLVAATGSVRVAYAADNTNTYGINESNDTGALLSRLDAGVAPAVNTIAGLVWDDANYDGLRDDDLLSDGSAREPGISDVQVDLWMSDDGTTYTTADTTSTDASGTYQFTGADGKGVDFTGGKTYKVCFANPKIEKYDWTVTDAGIALNANDGKDSDAVWTNASQETADSHAIALSDVNTVAALNVYAGLYQVSYISGKAWFDYNDNGIQDDQAIAEAAAAPLKIADMKVDLIDPSDPTSALASTTTSADGSYGFERLKAGNYRVQFDATTPKRNQASWELEWTKVLAGTSVDLKTNSDATPTDETTGVPVPNNKVATASHNVLTTTSSTSFKDIDAGMVPLLHISGVAWWDSNRNGKIDSTESKYPNVRVHLFKNGSKLAETVTDGAGAYAFNETNSFVADSLGTGSPIPVRILVNGVDKYKTVFYNADPETISFTVNGEHQEMARLVERESGSGAQNYYAEGHTAEHNLRAHSAYSPVKFNSGFYTIPEHRVTYVPNNGTASWGGGESTITVKEGRLVPNQTVTRGGYTFAGWFLAPADNYSWNFTYDQMPARDIRLVAHWDRIPTYRVYYNANGGGGAVPLDATQYYAGNNVNVLTSPQPTRSGYTFQGWSTAPGSSALISRFSITGDTWLYAVWRQNPAVVTPPVVIVTPPEDTPPAVTPPVTTPPATPPVVTPPTTGGSTPTPTTTLTDIMLAGVPLGNAGLGNVWSLLNLILSIVALIITLVLLVTLIVRKRNDSDTDNAGEGDSKSEAERQQYLAAAASIAAQREARAKALIDAGTPPFAAVEQAAQEISLQENKEDEQPKVRRRWLKVIAMILGVIPAILFIILENTTLPMVWIDRWTVLIASVFIAHLVVVIIQIVAKKEVDNDDRDNIDRRDSLNAYPGTGAAGMQPGAAVSG